MKKNTKTKKSYEYEEAKDIVEMLSKLPKETRDRIADIIKGAELVNIK